MPAPLQNHSMQRQLSQWIWWTETPWIHHRHLSVKLYSCTTGILLYSWYYFIILCTTPFNTHSNSLTHFKLNVYTFKKRKKNNLNCMYECLYTHCIYVWNPKKYLKCMYEHFYMFKLNVYTIEKRRKKWLELCVWMFIHAFNIVYKFEKQQQLLKMHLQTFIHMFWVQYIYNFWKKKKMTWTACTNVCTCIQCCIYIWKQKKIT